jgi:phosphate:Na+ symporter
MQSATAVTFILVNMVGSGLIGCRQALAIIAWANVGLTVLAFIAGLSIRTEVLYLVGMSGLAMTFCKRPGAQLVAGVWVGISLLLFGLQTISAGARPLQELAWFQSLMHETVHSPLIGFAAGFVLALLVQSNTAAALIVIALAGAGTLDLPQASAILYGTNLGTIPIRMVLAAGLHGSAKQLVRFEDFFCLVSGVVMMLLYYVEQWLHLPLVGALAQLVCSEVTLQLAVVFLLSNLVPALLLVPLSSVVERILSSLWPPGKEEEDAVPKFLRPQAHADPATALDLILREEARLLRHAGGYVQQLRKRPEAKGMSNEEIHRAFDALAQGIAEFNTELARNPAAVRSAERLKLAQEELALIGDLEESARELAEAFPHYTEGMDRVVELLTETWGLAVRAADGLRADDIAKLRDATRRRGPLLDALQAQMKQPGTEGSSAAFADTLYLAGAVERLAWLLHRLAKILAGASAHGATFSTP